MEQRGLLLLDLHGVLCCKAEDKARFALGPDVLDFYHYRVKLRTGYKPFIEHCFARYSVGIYSSTTERNATKILDRLLTTEQRRSLVVCWFRDRTRLDPDYGTDEAIQRHDTVKHLSDVLACPTVNEHRRYSLYNTIMVDDSPSKLRFMPKGQQISNVVIATTDTGDAEDTELLRIVKEIDDRFSDLNMSMPD